MLKTREYTLCSPFRANAHNSSLLMNMDKGYTTALLTLFRKVDVISSWPELFLFFSESVFANLIWISWSHKHVIFICVTHIMTRFMLSIRYLTGIFLPTFVKKAQNSSAIILLSVTFEFFILRQSNGESLSLFRPIT